MPCIQSMDTWGSTLAPPCPLYVGQKSSCWRNQISTRGVVYCRWGWHSTRVTLYAILYWGAGFHFILVHHVSGKTQSDHIETKWVQVRIPAHKTHSGALFFYQVSYCGLGKNFGTLPNGKDTWISLHKTSVGIVLQEIPHIDTRDTWWYRGLVYVLGRRQWTSHPHPTIICWM